MITRNLYVLVVSFQIAFMITISQTTEEPDSAIDELKLIEAFHNILNPPKFKMFLLINTRKTQSNVKLDLPAPRDLSLREKIDLKKPLVFLIHGFLSDGSEKWLVQLTRAYLKRKDVNVFIVDWGTGALTMDYFAAVEKITLVVNELVSFIKLLIEKTDVRVPCIHVIGHSLGAHIAGLVGKKIPDIHRITGKLLSKSNNAIWTGGTSKEISPVKKEEEFYKNRTFALGLDPAGYQFPSTSLRLSSKDATHVDVIHTNNLLGTTDLLGQVDFYINGGEVQPGCENNLKTINIVDWFFGNVCSHSKAINYFIESIENPKCLFVATETMEEASKLQPRDFDEQKHTVLGLDTFKYQHRGAFYIVTNDSPPYCKNFSKN